MKILAEQHRSNHWLINHVRAANARAQRWRGDYHFICRRFEKAHRSSALTIFPKPQMQPARNLAVELERTMFVRTRSRWSVNGFRESALGRIPKIKAPHPAQPLKRIRPARTKSLAWLCCSPCKGVRFLTGQTIIIDGGVMAA